MPPARRQSTRGDIERRSTVAVAYLHQLPRWLLFVVVLGLAIAGIFGPAPFGAIALLVIAAFLAWLGYLSWPVLTPSARVVRVASVLVVVAAAVVTFQD